MKTLWRQWGFISSSHLYCSVGFMLVVQYNVLSGFYREIGVELLLRSSLPLAVSKMLASFFHEWALDTPSTMDELGRAHTHHFYFCSEKQDYITTTSIVRWCCVREAWKIARCIVGSNGFWTTTWFRPWVIAASVIFACQAAEHGLEMRVSEVFPLPLLYEFPRCFDLTSSSLCLFLFAYTRRLQTSAPLRSRRRKMKGRKNQRVGQARGRRSGGRRRRRVRSSRRHRSKASRRPTRE